MEEKELFEHYEHQVWEFSPAFKKIIGASVLINLLGLLTIAQLNIFTTRGCDTPYVGAVCQVLDSAYIASVFWGRGFDADSRPYDRKELGAEDEVTIINVGDRLEYPEGYFYKDEVAEVLPVNEFGNPTSENPLATTPSEKDPGDMGVQVLPTPNDNVGKQPIPDKPFEWGGSTAPVYKNKNNPKTDSPKKQGKNGGIMSNESPKDLPDENTVAGTKKTPKPTPTPTPKDAGTAKDEFNKTFNKAPLQDFADGVIARIDSPKPEEKVDLKQAFKVELNGVLLEDGTFDADKSKFTGKQEGNPQMIKVAREAIQAVGDSKILGYLRELGVDKVNIVLVQDDKQVTAVIRSVLPSAEKARTVTSGFRTSIGFAKFNTKDDAEVQSLLKAVTFADEGKNFVINFVMPKEEAHQLIDKKLQEARQKKSQTNNGEAEKSATGKVK